MSKKSIGEYVKEQLSQNISVTQVTERLKQAGWGDADIYKAIQKASASVNSSRNKYAVPALAFGIVSMLTAVIVPFSVVGIVFGILGIQKSDRKTMSLWGLCLSGASFLLGVVLIGSIAFGMSIGQNMPFKKHFGPMNSGSYDRTADFYQTSPSYDSGYNGNEYYSDTDPYGNLDN